MNLNENQKKAVDHEDGPCLCIAGPGSGKTRVITERIHELIRKKLSPPSKILVVTFSKASAKEMEERFQKNYGESRVNFGTFHSVFLKILTEELHYESKDIIDEKMKDMMIQKIKRKLERSDLISKNMDKETFINNQYEEEKRKNRQIDFDDILVKTKEVLLTNKKALNKWREKYKYILVDEFQDVNELQFQCLKLLIYPHNNLFVVGDDDQSIYGFRGASPDVMIRFSKEFKNTNIIQLKVNYRSGKEIVEKSKKLISQNKKRYEKEIISGNDTESKVLLNTLENEKEEMAFISKKVEEYHEKGIPYSEMSVLFRTLIGTESLSEEFIKRDIPYVIQEKITNVFRNPIVKPVFSYLNFALGDESKENFIKFMNKPDRKISRFDLPDDVVTLKSLEKKFYESESPFHSENPLLMKLVNDLHILVTLKEPFEMIQFIRKGMGYDRYLLEHKTHTENLSHQMKVLDEVTEYAKNHHSIRSFYEFIVSFTKMTELEEKKKDSKSSVHVSTIHHAKGLEYDVVFIPDLMEGILPHEKNKGNKNSLEEERRILYVGMTRAKKILHLLSAKNRFGKKMEISRFLKGFDECF